ncbi:GTP 3',8-cyclase MoaA [Cupriavidus plantarum]|uniref:GTP 3',8-cyclase n=1 Tax=Cupriavidus plantarum TaxID=942865 RepID=A0A316EWM7_9BURK|nr:GTP 3',8-cyclase MoaA [Cupriavidus plantarum]NYH99539.1 cyclic pyranopterin phosphate synthase [Cupriavidus plantarum]PWK36751.1 cyclic pyranopterin monophosphate synthase subunit MoaA [Cupriavidus plantarum]RLK44636.1 cyclic pyranopterin monophosphate synthase subunit MoaA [Cupriavidus plantarum]CAG2151076.1 GTP 3',8-cyclase [Cupriavidus plantarum]SMR65839.1 cyclic pyranopterin monophosphate synthase subunit MoaA [Cupriavidus plantarum]
MTDTVIPILDLRDHRYRSMVPAIPARLTPPTGLVTDTRGRMLHDLRISVTDRCNFRCVYCMPKEVFDKDYTFLPHSALLSFEEIERAARLFVAHGVEKIRLTGGEPLLRKNIERLVEMLARIETVSGKPLDLTLTTNASLLARKARALRDAGLSRVSVSLDAIDDATFRRMNDVDFAVRDVLDGIEAAQAVGLAPIKVNMVVKRGTNDAEVVPMARHFRNTGIIVRFIEFMDVGASNHWQMDEVLPSNEVVRRIDEAFPLEMIAANYTGETAERWRYRDGAGEIGVISSVTHAFCGDCSRIRLSTEGKLYQCLFATEGYDLRALLRGGHSDLEVSNAIAQVWRGRTDNYSEQRGDPAVRLARAEQKIEMSYIGG